MPEQPMPPPMDQPMDQPHPPPAITGAPPPGSSFSHSLRNEKARWWKPVVGITGGALMFLAVSIGLTILAIIYETFVSGGAFDPGSVSPAMYAALLAGLVVLIPIAILMQRVLHGQAVGHLFSVDGRMRWRWLVVALSALIIPFSIYLVVFESLAPEAGARADNWLAYLIVGALIMPFQAAAEETFFRGYVQRAVGSWFSGEKAALTVGTLASALLFMAAHVAADPWLILYYFTFGATLSLLAHYTGGLEAGIAVHVVNNVVAGILGALTSDPDKMFDRSAGVGGPFMMVQIAAIALFAFGLYWLARRRRLSTSVMEDHPLQALSENTTDDVHTAQPQQGTGPSREPDGDSSPTSPLHR